MKINRVNNAPRQNFTGIYKIVPLVPKYQKCLSAQVGTDSRVRIQLIDYLHLAEGLFFGKGYSKSTVINFKEFVIGITGEDFVRFTALMKQFKTPKVSTMKAQNRAFETMLAEKQLPLKRVLLIGLEWCTSCKRALCESGIPKIRQESLYTRF